MPTLSQLKLSLEEKLDVLKKLDEEVLSLIEDEGGLADEIDQADTFKAGICAALVKIDQLRVAPPTAAGMPDPASDEPTTLRQGNRVNVYPFVQWGPYDLDNILGLI